MEQVAAHRELGFTALKQACPDLPHATLARLLKSLLADHFLARTDRGTYRTGPAAAAFARTLLGLFSSAELMAPIVHDLAVQTDESAAYTEPEGGKIRILCKTERPDSFHYLPIGALTGRPDKHLFSLAFLAFAPSVTVHATLCGEAGVSSAARARAEKRLKRITARGLATGPEDADVPISRVVAPVIGPDGSPKGAIGVTLLGRRVPAVRLAVCRDAVLGAARCAAAALEQYPQLDKEERPSS